MAPTNRRNEAIEYAQVANGDGRVWRQGRTKRRGDGPLGYRVQKNALSIGAIPRRRTLNDLDIWYALAETTANRMLTQKTKTNCIMSARSGTSKTGPLKPSRARTEANMAIMTTDTSAANLKRHCHFSFNNGFHPRAWKGRVFELYNGSNVHRHVTALSTIIFLKRSNTMIFQTQTSGRKMSSTISAMASSDIGSCLVMSS